MSFCLGAGVAWAGRAQLSLLAAPYLNRNLLSVVALSLFVMTPVALYAQLQQPSWSWSYALAPGYFGWSTALAGALAPPLAAAAGFATGGLLGRRVGRGALARFALLCPALAVGALTLRWAQIRVVGTYEVFHGHDAFPSLVPLWSTRLGWIVGAASVLWVLVSLWILFQARLFGRRLEAAALRGRGLPKPAKSRGNAGEANLTSGVAAATQDRGGPDPVG